MLDKIEINENKTYQFDGDIHIIGNVGKNTRIDITGHLIVDGNIDTGAKVIVNKTLIVNGNIEDHVSILSKETCNINGNIGNHCHIQVFEGDIKLKNIGHHATLDTMEGNIEANNVGENAFIEVSLGDGQICIDSLSHHSILQTEQGDITLTNAGNHVHIKSVEGDVFVHNSNDSVSIETNGYVTQDHIKPLNLLTKIQKENETIMTNLYLGNDGKVIYAGKDISNFIEDAGNTSFYFGHTKITKEIGAITKFYIKDTQNELLRCWHVPPKADLFIGRTIPLKKLEEHFSNSFDKNTKPLVCFGLGGIGKTALALNFVHEHVKKKKYKHIFWFSADSKESLIKDYLDLAKKLECPHTEEKAQISYVLDWFNNRTGFLLIYNNAVSQDTIDSYIRSQGHHILITSRHSVWWPYDMLSLELFSREECREYIRQSLNDKLCIEKDMDGLAETFGYLPLALKQVCHYLQENQEINIKNYLYRYKHNRKLYLQVRTLQEEREMLFKSPENTELLNEDENRVYSLWNSRHTQLKFLKTANQLLEAFSCMHSDLIPLEFCRCWAGENNEITILESLSALKNYSFIQIHCEKDNPKSISIHPLLQTVIRLQMPEEKLRACLANCILTMNKYCPEEDNSFAGLERKKQMVPHLEYLYEYGHTYFHTQLKGLLNGMMGLSSIEQYYQHPLTSQAEQDRIATALKCLRFSSIFKQHPHLKLLRPILKQIIEEAFLPSRPV